MFTFERGDYKLVFEYDTVEELQEYLKLAEASYEQIQKETKRYEITQKIIEKEEQEPKVKEHYNFFDLETKFIVEKKKMGKVSKSTYKAYEATFTKLKEFFKYEHLDKLEIEDYERFRDYLSKGGLVGKTVNNHMSYVKMFMKEAKKRKMIVDDSVCDVEMLLESEPKIKKVNYTDEEINAILSFDFEQKFKDIYLIAIYSGMRVNEIHSLKKENIVQDKSGIYYFDIVKSKTDSGVRQVPIHKDILEKVLKMDFPLLKGMTDNGAQKAILRQLYRVVEKDQGKTFHTFRAKFIEKCIKEHTKDILAIQEIVGHSKEDSKKLTINTYGKGFPLEYKKTIVDSVSYS